MKETARENNSLCAPEEEYRREIHGKRGSPTSIAEKLKHQLKLNGPSLII